MKEFWRLEGYERESGGGVDKDVIIFCWRTIIACASNVFL